MGSLIITSRTEPVKPIGGQSKTRNRVKRKEYWDNLDCVSLLILNFSHKFIYRFVYLFIFLLCFLIIFGKK